MARGFGKIQPARFIYLGLHNGGNNLLDGVFHRDDVPSAALRQFSQTGVNGRSLSASGWPSQQQQAGCLPQKYLQLLEHVQWKSQIRQSPSLGVVKEPKHD